MNVYGKKDFEQKSIVIPGSELNAMNDFNKLQTVTTLKRNQAVISFYCNIMVKISAANEQDTEIIRRVFS